MISSVACIIILPIFYLVTAMISTPAAAFSPQSQKILQSPKPISVLPFNPSTNKQANTMIIPQHQNEKRLFSKGGDIPFFAQVQMSTPAKEGKATITNRLPLGTIFDSRDYIFSTATNVRTYEWTLKETEELFDDLLDAFNGTYLPYLGVEEPSSSSTTSSTNSFRLDYELSQIVLVPMEWDRDLFGLGNRYDVHDGQQRLVTICLLFAALRDAFANDGDMDDTAAELSDMLKPSRARKADLLRVKLHKRDNVVLSHILNNERDQLESINLEKLTGANTNIHKNFHQLVTRVDAMKKEERLKFLDYVVEKVYMLVCIPETSSIARSLVMAQGKGKDNEPIDDFKGLVCFRYTSEEKNMYKAFDDWDKLAALSDLDNESVGRSIVSDACLLRASAMMRTKIRKSDQLFLLECWLRSYVMEENKEGDVFFQKKVQPASLTLGQYREGNFNLFKFYAKFRKSKRWADVVISLRFLREMTTSIASTKEAEIIILELLLRAGGLGEGKVLSVSDLANYLHEVEILVLWMTFTRPSAKQRSEKIFSFLDEIANPKKIPAVVYAITPDDRSSIMEAIRNFEFGSTAMGKRSAIALLKYLNGAYLLAQDGNQDIDAIIYSSDAHLELVLPAKATKKAWGEDWPVQEEQDTWVSNLGNLVLLTKKATNREAKMAFNDKKQRFSNEVYPLTARLAEIDRWNRKSLVTNMSIIEEMIHKIWEI